VSNITTMSTEEVLRRGFSPTSGVLPTKQNQSSQSWDVLATALQLSLERYILSTPTTQSLARKAFQSHIRAYATHTATERKFFDIKELHLGHLCKSFGLRETPSGMGTGRTGGTKGRRGIGAGEGKRKKGGDDGETAGADDIDDAAKKMREKVRMNRKVMMSGGGADEFNIA